MAGKHPSFFQKSLNYIFGLLLIWIGLSCFFDSLRAGFIPEDLGVKGFFVMALGVLILFLSGKKFILILLGSLVVVSGLILSGLLNLSGLLKLEIAPEWVPISVIILGLVLILIVHKVGHEKASLQTNY